jgi:HAD superfamily hydrolase (TIGR01549 family)
VLSSEIIKLGPVKVVSWDVDGTLYSVGRLRWRLLGLLLREAAGGRGREARRELAALRGYRAAVEAARRAGGALDEALRDGSRRAALLDLEGRWYGRALRQAGPRAGVVELLSFLAAEGITQVTLSDYRAEYKLDALRLRSHFAAAYAGERLGYVKPSPKAFAHIASDFSVPAASILHIGDRAETDAAAASAAGCRCLILGRDFRDFRALLRQFRLAL